jgi:hypothetical protein
MQYSGTPVPVAGLTHVSQVVANMSNPDTPYEHTCAVVEGGALKCWGEGHLGQLGNGGTVGSASPVTVAGLSGVTSLSASALFTCAADGTGAVWCWGDNFFGELGVGATDSLSAVPVHAFPPASTPALQVATNDVDACALLTDHTVWCWGNAYSSTPNKIVGLPDPLTDPVTAISGGGYFTCALLQSGAVKCWGVNDFGQLGNGTAAAGPTPQPVQSVVGFNGTTPATTATAISSGWDHSCAVMGDKSLRCWGNNGSGQLGDGTLVTRTKPVPVSALAGATRVSSGMDFTCAVVTGGTVKCWGSNLDGELGNGAIRSKVAVTVVGLTGTRPPSAANTVPWAPGAPKGSAGVRKVTLTWAASAPGGKAITDYIVQYSSNNGASWTTFNDGVHSTTGATVTGLVRGKTYVFHVAAKNGNGVGAYGAKSTAVKAN